MAKVMVGLSGGVDSAVAAYLLKQAGHEVIAAYMRNWDSLANNDFLGNPYQGPLCPQEADYEDAKKVAEKLGIPLFRVDFIEEYWNDVFLYFIKEYQSGRTPNPDVFCNKYIKFDAFWKFALTHQVDYMATGHYARYENGELRKARDLTKDQSYFLSLLTHEQLSRTLFPLGNLLKKEVRQIASSIGLNVANKKDSTGICFIGERHFRQFLQNYIPAQPGEIIDIERHEVVGQHYGVMYYTLGQRKGLGIGGIKNHQNGSWFVVGKNIEKQELYVVQGDESEWLYHECATITSFQWLGNFKLEVGQTYGVKFRYRQPDIPIKVIEVLSNSIVVESFYPVRAITPGQIAVLYQDEVCVGAGIIDSVAKKG
jgi:tRNA-specific 2-thiouridylase